MVEIILGDNGKPVRNGDQFGLGRVTSTESAAR